MVRQRRGKIILFEARDGYSDSVPGTKLFEAESLDEMADLLSVKVGLPGPEPRRKRDDEGWF